MDVAVVEAVVVAAAEEVERPSLLNIVVLFLYPPLSRPFLRRFFRRLSFAD